MIPINNKKRSQKSERQAAIEIGGRVNANSGAIAGMKGDVKSPTFLLEDKFTDKGSYSLTLPTLHKLEKEAFQNRRKPLLRVTIQGETFYVINRRTFQTLLHGQHGHNA